MAPLFEMQNVEKHFGTVIALGGINFSVSEGECRAFWVITEPVNRP